MNIQEMIKDTYSNLKFYVRDVDIEDKIIYKYKIGDIIYEKAFVDCTKKISGLSKKVRYFILSNKAKDLSKYETKTKWGLCVIDKNSAFKILDIYRRGEKTLIILLHVPEEIAEQFKKVHSNFDKEVCKKIKDEFDKLYNREPDKDLKDDWYERIKFPIGIDNNNNLIKSNKELPVITKENIYDENKMIIDFIDHRRIKYNIEILKKLGLPYNEKMGKIPTNSTTEIINKQEIFKRLIKDFTMATICKNIITGKKHHNKDFIEKMNSLYSFNELLLDNELEFLEAINRNMVDRNDISDLVLLFQNCAIYLWVLKLIKEMPSSCVLYDSDEITKIILGKKKLNIKTLKMRSKKEILMYADLVFRFEYACQKCLMDDIKIVKLDPIIVQEQKKVFEYITNFNLDKVLKKQINVRYQYKDFDFNFQKPTKLNITKTKTNEEDIELMILESDDTKIRMCFLDLGVCPKNRLQQEFSLMKNDLEKTLNIKEITNMKTDNLGELINVIGIHKNMGVSQFHFILNNHYIRLDCLLGKNLNYDNMDEIHKNICNSCAIKIILSIKTKMTNTTHANELYVPILNDLKDDDNTNPNVIINAIGNGLSEQLVSEGILNDNETFNNRIDDIVNNTLNYMKQVLPENENNKMFYYKDYNNDKFDFKIYVQDMIINFNKELKAVRQFNVFFIDKRYNEFYHLVLSRGPLNQTDIIFGEVNLKNDKITKELYNNLKNILDNICYRDNEFKLNEALKNFNNTLDNSINTNLKIKSKKENIITDSKNLYKIILTCGEFEEPYIDEHNIEIVINNEKKLMSLIKKYDKINEEYFQNKLAFKTFNLDDKKYIQELIKVLKNSIEHN